MAEPSRVRDLLGLVPGLMARLVARMAEEGLLRAWPEIAGPAAARSRAEAIEAGILRVAVDSSGWLHRLTLDEPRLLARCRAIAPTMEIRAIRFHLAPPAAAVGSPGGAPHGAEGEGLS